MIITIGRNWSAKQCIGKINIAKSRRGDNVIQPYVRTSDGLFYPCSDITYQRFMVMTQRGSYTYNELVSMDAIYSVVDETKNAANANDATAVVDKTLNDKAS